MPRDMTPELTNQEPTTIELSRQEVIDLLKALDVQGKTTKVTKRNFAFYQRWHDLRHRLQSERYKWD